MFSNWVSDVAHQAAGHPIAAAIAVFLLAASEAIPILGAIVPGTAVILAIAALTATGPTQILTLTMAGTLGAILGDGVSFLAGRYLGGFVRAGGKAGRLGSMVEDSRPFLVRHGGKSVFLARFVPGIRAIVPLAAGMMEMPQRQFYATNIASAVVWAPLHIVPAALLGASIWQGDIKVMAVAGLLILVMAVAIYRVHVFLRRSEQLEPAPKTSPIATIAPPPPRSKEARNGTA
jgi:undecaprenyl-diphosphatase